MGAVARLVVMSSAFALVFGAAAPASADDFSGCESVPTLGLNPQIRKICDDPIRPDGSWTRYRQFISLDSTRSSCGGVYYQGGICPPELQRDFVPGSIGGVETYYLTADGVPPGEPGHLDNPIRCTAQELRCDAP